MNSLIRPSLSVVPWNSDSTQMRPTSLNNFTLTLSAGLPSVVSKMWDESESFWSIFKFTLETELKITKSADFIAASETFLYRNATQSCLVFDNKSAAFVMFSLYFLLHFASLNLNQQLFKLFCWQLAVGLGISPFLLQLRDSSCDWIQSILAPGILFQFLVRS